MPFPERVRRIEAENADRCEVCRDEFTDDMYLELHSVTSLHLVKNKDKDNPRFVVTNPPVGHEHLRGKTLDLSIYKEGIERGSDAVCLCVSCHQHIHRMALKAARKVGFKGKTPPPQVIEQVTKFYLKNGIVRKKKEEKDIKEKNKRSPKQDTRRENLQPSPDKTSFYFPE